MRWTVDLNSDLGESFGSYVIGQDEAVLERITSANIACGFHAGDHNVLRRTVKMAAENGIGLGAHPGLPDRLGFGRRYIQVDPDDVYNMTVYQLGAVKTFAALEGKELQHVKPHGAMYNMAAKDAEMAQAIAEAVAAVDPSLILFGLAGGELVKAGEKAGLQTAHEVFADRTYQPDGSLTPRSQPNCLIDDPQMAVDRVVRMVTKGKVTAVDGTDVSIQADTVCVHGDSPQALAFVEALREGLTGKGIHIQRIGKR
ncbi:MAG: LamB/YcsF family protein [Firmicutes bacterium]|nr:LamB/YcsF family protein [Bacillota bacterium]